MPRAGQCHNRTESVHSTHSPYGGCVCREVSPSPRKHLWCNVNSRENSSSAQFLKNNQNSKSKQSSCSQTCSMKSLPQKSKYMTLSKYMTKQPKVSLVKCYPSFYTVPFLFFARNSTYCLKRCFDSSPQMSKLTCQTNTSYLKNISDRCKSNTQTIRRIPVTPSPSDERRGAPGSRGWLSRCCWGLTQFVMKSSCALRAGVCFLLIPRQALS